MIVSIATAVLPVWRSPMISSRCPRPTGVIASIALRPVCSGSLTGWRATMPGALISMRRRSLVSIGPRPSIGSPRALTTRAARPLPTRTSAARGLDLDAAALLGIDRPAAVDRLAERVDDAADERLADRNLGDPAGALHGVAFLDHVGLAEERGADVVLFEVQGEAVNIVGKLQQLAGRRLIEAVDARDAVAGRDDRADLQDFDRLVVVLDLLLDDPADFRRADLHVGLR